jgi:hypothetical protein
MTRSKYIEMLENIAENLQFMRNHLDQVERCAMLGRELVIRTDGSDIKFIHQGQYLEAMGSKVDRAQTSSWIRKPADIVPLNRTPTTRLPVSRLRDFLLSFVSTSALHSAIR